MLGCRAAAAVNFSFRSKLGHIRIDFMKSHLKSGAGGIEIPCEYCFEYLLVLETLVIGRRRFCENHFFNCAGQLSTTVMGTWVVCWPCGSTDRRKRLPSEVTSQPKSTGAVNSR